MLSTLFAPTTWAQIIKGTVLNRSNEPIVGVSLWIKGARMGGKTNQEGKYEIQGLSEGSYTLVLSAVGIQRQERTVYLAGEQELIEDFVVDATNEQLQEVVISSTKKQYKVDTTSLSLRLGEPLIEIPQNIQVVTNKVLSDQQVVSMSDGLIRNVSGAVRLEHWGDLYANINMRGSQIQAFRNGFNVVGSYWGPLTEDMSFVDHIEFVKGPAGFMLANGDPSGLYNVVTKKPTGVTKGEATFTLGSFDLFRGTLDLDGKLSKDGKLLYRLNVMGQNKASHRPYEYNDRYSIAPVISYQVDEKTKLTAEYTLQHVRMSEVGSYYVFGPESGGYATLPVDFTMTNPGIPPTNINDHSLFLTFEHKLDDHWKLTAQGSYFFYDQVGYSSWPSKVNEDRTVVRNVGIWDAQGRMALGQVFVNGDVQTGAIKHRILAGIDMGKKTYIADWGQSHDLDRDSATLYFDPLNPTYGIPTNGLPNFDRNTSLTSRALAAGGLQGQRYTGLYFQDELGFFENRLRLTLAGRYTYARQYYGADADEAKHFTPRIGLSASVDQHTSVYALYDQAFVPQSVSGALEEGSELKPITGSNTELGIKRDWFGGNLSTTLSVYRILKNNELTASENSTPANPLSIELGQKKAQGVEFDVRGNISTYLSIIANYAYTDSKVSKVNPGVPNVSVGDVMPGFSKHVVNGWVNYKLPVKALKGLGVSAGYTGLLDRATDNWGDSDLRLPDYHKIDGGIFWEGTKMRITANAFNIFDKYLFSGSAYNWLSAYYWQTEAPRNYRLSVSYSF
ncbi:iron complex outermembrane recepter protein [Olivibacter domesticus]|uniref:Iron complex outermembrane recepter protein n=1 Tax=Olivibacter domesticus TaxID=407022 RepID=A0A1H7SLN0_OLID1|nr:iron complex outermembrane recepter protein [Olivibacter domesticus]